jgi:dienelactone hydrolase
MLLAVGPGRTGQAAPAASGWTPIDPPAGIEAPGADWILVDAPDGGKLVAAVYRPTGPGPFPIVVVYHGGSGLAGFPPIADFFARAGFLSVAGCWQYSATVAGLDGGANVCSRAPPLGVVLADRELKTPRALIAAARALPDARGDRVGAFGTSMGGYPALAAAAFAGEVQAVVVDSGVYRPPPPAPDAVDLAKDIRVPVLILHGTADAPAPVADARAYERLARGLGNPIASHYYEGVGHAVGFRPETRDDVLERARSYFVDHLVDPAAPGGTPGDGPAATSAAAARDRWYLEQPGATPSLATGARDRWYLDHTSMPPHRPE